MCRSVAGHGGSRLRLHVRAGRGRLLSLRDTWASSLLPGGGARGIEPIAPAALGACSAKTTKCALASCNYRSNTHARLVVYVTAKVGRSVAADPVNHLVRDDEDQVKGAMDQVQDEKAVDGDKSYDGDKPRDGIKLAVCDSNHEEFVDHLTADDDNGTAEEEADDHEDGAHHAVEQEDVAVAGLVTKTVTLACEVNHRPQRGSDYGFPRRPRAS